MITVDEWAEKSRRGEVCGILGCKNKPVIKCPHCGNHYCREHAFVIGGPGHPERQAEGEDLVRKAALERADLRGGLYLDQKLLLSRTLEEC